MTDGTGNAAETGSSGEPCRAARNQYLAGLDERAAWKGVSLQPPHLEGDPEVLTPIDHEFDPNEMIASPDPPLEGIERLTQEALKRAFTRGRATAREPWDIRNFDGLEDTPETVATGVYAFIVKRRPFYNAITAAGNAVGALKQGKPAQAVAVRISLSQFHIKLRVHNLTVVFEEIVPVEHLVTGLSDEQSIAFQFDFHALKDIVRAGGSDETMTGTYHAKRHRLVIRADLASDAFVRGTFRTYSANGFGAEGLKRLSSLRYLNKFDPRALRSGLELVALFAKQDHVSRTLSVVSVRSGTIRGGTHSAIASYTSPKLSGLDVHIKYDLLGMLINALPSFDLPTYLFDNDFYHIFYDERTFLAFEKSGLLTFPETPAFLQDNVGAVLLPREPLISELTRLFAASHRKRNSDLKVTLRASSDIFGRVMFLYCEDPIRGFVTGQLDMRRGKQLGVDCLPFTHQSVIRATYSLYFSGLFGIMRHEARRPRL